MQVYLMLLWCNNTRSKRKKHENTRALQPKTKEKWCLKKINSNKMTREEGVSQWKEGGPYWVHREATVEIRGASIPLCVWLQAFSSSSNKTPVLWPLLCPNQLCGHCPKHVQQYHYFYLLFSPLLSAPSVLSVGLPCSRHCTSYTTSFLINVA